MRGTHVRAMGVCMGSGGRELTLGAALDFLFTKYGLLAVPATCDMIGTSQQLATIMTCDKRPSTTLELSSLHAIAPFGAFVQRP